MGGGWVCGVDLPRVRVFYYLGRMYRQGSFFGWVFFSLAYSEDWA